MSKLADIRNSTVSLLTAANIASGKVFNSKVSPAMLKNTPSVVVYSESVQAKNQGAHRPAFVYSVTMQVDAIVSMTTTWADDADALVESIINTLMSNEEWVAQFESIDGFNVSYSFYDDVERVLATAGITIVGNVFKAF